MAVTEYKQGSVIIGADKPLNNLLLITKGEAEASLNGYKLRLDKADVIGICDLERGSYSFTYTAVSDVNVIANPYEGFSSLDALVQDNADIGYVIVNSMCRQITQCLEYMAKLGQEAEETYEMVQEIYNEYVRLSKTYAFTPKKLPGLEELSSFSESEPIEGWLRDYYLEISELDSSVHNRFFHSKPGISTGFLHRGAEDIFRVLQSCLACQEYLTGISKLFLDNSGLDLFALVCELHLNTINIKGADSAVEQIVTPLTGLLAGMTGIDHSFYNTRLNQYSDELAVRRETQVLTDAPKHTGLNKDLQDSINTILDYSECSDEMYSKFMGYVSAYTEFTDRNSTDDDVYDIRKGLTATFYEVYRSVLIKSLGDEATPTIIKMFLNFGYVDPTLSGYETASYLYSIADSLKGDPDAGIYTISDWLASIYYGKNEPSLSEFEMDYQAYVRDLKQTQRLGDREVTRMLADNEAKLRFEMENAFPVVNRVTFGNPTKFCPVLSDHNIQRNIEDLLVTPAAIKDIMDEIRSIDFSAFYRETSFSDVKAGVPSESVSVEVLPNIILMPNAGTRGSMWQEIEGRVRTTPARMFMPIILENDLKQVLLRLTGEFRWEMCKRIQGSRWGDVTDPSLTSFYSDYLQFYMNNRSISMQTMNAIRNELSSARNNYKTVFVANYAVWILNESNGSSRLNNLAIAILMQFCPFSSPIREKLATNMRYSEALNRYKIKQQKRVEHVSRVIKMVRMKNKEVPKILLDELEYAKR